MNSDLVLSSDEQKPWVDVLVPTYNQAHVVSETIESILSQDYPNFKIYISDDASTDDTQLILKKYHAMQQEKIILNINNKNLGITNNINLLISLSKSPYVVYFAGDDLMRSDKITKQVEALLKNPEASGCMSDVYVYDTVTQKKRYYRNKDFESEKARRIIGCFNQTPSCSLMVRRSEMKKMQQDSRLPVVGDWLYVNEIAINGLIYIKEPLSTYRRHSGNITSVGADRIYLDDRLVAIDILFANHQKYYFSCKKARSNVFLAAAGRYFHSKKYKKFIYFFIISFLEYPINENIVFVFFKFLRKIIPTKFFDRELV